MSDLTLNEQKSVRTVLRMLRRQLGGWRPLSKVLRYEPDTLEKVASGRRAATPRMALLVARFVGVSFDEMVEGKYTPPGTCPHCGHPPDFSDEKTDLD